ncbi:MAG: TonB-dependent receptor [Bacteroidota bacterium]
MLITIQVVKALPNDLASGSISGKIKDSETGDLMIGASIGIKGTAIGAFSGPDGTFYIAKAPEGDHSLVIRSIGYIEQEIPIRIVSGEETKVNIKLKSQATKLDEIVVTGLRKSQIDAINSKRQSLNNKDVLKTNDIGRLPDINVAEASQRIAGVSIETDNGEGRFISIRGIQPALNNVTLNNTNIGSTNQGRETPLDLLPVEMISSIEVSKANTPDMEGTAIGGAVNINTISAFDRAQSEFLIASVDGLIQNQQADYQDDDFPFRAAVTGGKRFGEKEKFGVVVSGNYFKRDFSVSIADPDRWQMVGSNITVPDPDNPGETIRVPSYADPSGAWWGIGPQGDTVRTPILAPNEIELQIEDNERTRYGLTADFEFRPTDKSKIYLRSLFTHTDETDLNSEFELTVFGLADQQLTNLTPTTGRYSRGSGELDLSSNEIEQDLFSLTLGGEHRFTPRLKADVYGTISRADQTLNSIDGTYENPNSSANNTEPLLAATYDIAPFFFDITAENLETARDPSIYVLRNLNFRRNNTVAEDMYEASLDLRYDFDLGDFPAYLKVGGRIRTRDKAVDRSRDEYNDDSEDGLKAINPYSLDQFSIDPLAPYAKTDEELGADPNVHGDALAFKNFFANPASLSDTTRIYFRQDDTNDEVYDEDINYVEDVSAAYVMGVVDLKFMTVTAGVRVEHTATTSSPWVETGVDTNLGFEQFDFTNDYTNWMPSVHFRTNFSQNFIGRFSWSNTIGRPDYDQLSGTSEFEFFETSTPGVFTGSFEGANPDLKPLESMNLDLSLEYYFSSGGIASVGGFHKRIDNQIFNNRFTQNNTTFNGLFFEDLSFQRLENLETANLWGFEASYDQAFTFLPSPFDGFGITANVALIDSEVSYPGRENDDLPLLRQPENVYNIIPYYQKYGFEVRLAITHRSDFLVLPRSTDDGFVSDAVNFGGYSVKEFDRFEGARTAVDITAAYTFPSRNFKILAQARNVTNAPEQEFQGNVNRYDRYQLFGASYFLGFSVNL